MIAGLSYNLGIHAVSCSDEKAGHETANYDSPITVPFLLWFSLGSDVNYHCIMLCNLVTTLLHKVIYASLGMQSLASKNNNPLWDRLAKLCNQTCFIRGNRRIVRTQELAGEVPACMVLPF